MVTQIDAAKFVHIHFTHACVNIILSNYFNLTESDMLNLLILACPFMTLSLIQFCSVNLITFVSERKECTLICNSRREKTTVHSLVLML